MLTKMGWESGKGLGAKEDGATTHVKAAKRRDNLGLGADKSQEDNWLSHQLAFDDLLSRLNDHSENGSEGEKPTKKRKKHEMEKTARQSRKRVFYNRFIQSKDLSSKSAEDMACIFGQRSKSAPGTPQEQSEDEESDDSTASCPPPSFQGVQTINSGQSIQEYFEMKMKEMKAAREGKEVGGGNQVQVEIAKSEVQENGAQNSELADEELESKKKKKEKGRKRKLVTEDGEFKNDETGLQCVEDQCSAKKKKKNSKAGDMESGGENECKILKDSKSGKEKKKKRKELKFVDSETCEINEMWSGKMENLETEEATKGGKRKDKKKRKKDKTTTSVEMEMSCEIEEKYDQKGTLKKAKNFGEEKSCKDSLTEVKEIKEKGEKRNKKDKNLLSHNVDTIEIEMKRKDKKKKKKKDKSKESCEK
ncbi:hypothetical protein ACROYT_G017011 [Oculina patagonica]